MNYLGQKGYTIRKNTLSKQEIDEIYKDLTVAPYIPKSPVKSDSFPIYRESTQKLYIPRYYGVAKFGKPIEHEINAGLDINLEFKGELRDYQKNIVNTYLQAIHHDVGGGLLEVPCGRGKTICALNIISKIQKKTLIIVHKGFLLNQWIERIQEFLPGTRVGIIQGKIIDIENKDIVIGMLQSLSMKDYTCDLFSSFGLTVVDEVHHIGAEVFVRSLFKIVTKCVLGLSATMQRKDGLTKVFKMFLGDIIYTEKREGTDNVLVQAYTFTSSDKEFNEIETDFRGNPKYSTMISKLCGSIDRNKFILDIVEKLYQSDPDQQMMIIAHNKNILTYFHDIITEKGYATVGYYVGGMKEKDLKISETKNIIVATYAMASEALDIKTLTTLVMATPKTDVTQSIGRILRTKHRQPVVIDIVDTHDVFQNQFRKRCSYYKKEKYTIQKKFIQEEGEDTKLKGKCLLSFIKT